MHDPLTVAFEIRRPWPRRDRLYDSVRPHRPDRTFPRWRFKLRHECSACTAEERAEHAGRRFFPWWRPSSWSPFWTIAGRGWYWPSLITVWHREPRGHDSGEICRHYVRALGADGKWSSRILHGWRWHVHHWKIQVHSLQALRRWALTRCEWCGGRSHGGDRVNISHQWEGPRGRWWRGEPGLYHLDCSSISAAHAACTCGDPLTDYDGYGHCARCGKFRAFGRRSVNVTTDLILAGIPKGHRDPEVYATVRHIWESQREESVT